MFGVLKFIVVKDILGVNNVVFVFVFVEEVKLVFVYYLYLCCNLLILNILEYVVIECFILMFYRFWSSIKWSFLVS